MPERPVANRKKRSWFASLNFIPEPLYALVVTSYFGYTVARNWEEANSVER